MLQRFDERNRDLIVNVGGRLVHRDEAGVSPFDSSVQCGDAVWEGLRLPDGRILRQFAAADAGVSRQTVEGEQPDAA
jgi:branched-chain amino acid aminotransferase